MKYKTTLILSAIMLLTSICITYLTIINDQAPLRSLSEFPMQIGNWHGTISRFDEKVYEVLGVDDSILAHYQNDEGKKVELYIGYYTSQREGELIHSPKNCMPGAGWNIASIEPMAINYGSKDSDQARVNKVVLVNGSQKQVMLYWFHSRGRVIRSEYAEKIYLVWDSILRHRTDGSFVRLISPVTIQNEQQVTEQLEQFSVLLFPMLNNFIPG